MDERASRRRIIVVVVVGSRELELGGRDCTRGVFSDLRPHWDWE